LRWLLSNGHPTIEQTPKKHRAIRDVDSPHGQSHAPRGHADQLYRRTSLLHSCKHRFGLLKRDCVVAIPCPAHQSSGQSVMAMAEQRNPFSTVRSDACSYAAGWCAGKADPRAGGGHDFAREVSQHPEWPDVFGESVRWLDDHLKAATAKIGVACFG